MRNVRASLDCTLTITEPTVDYVSTRSASFEISHFDRAIKSSVSTLGDKRRKEITSLQRNVILGFLKDAIRLRIRLLKFNSRSRSRSNSNRFSGLLRT